ncbi:sensor domain-containing protein [Thalassotalea piscium]|uniref:Diguanylate cyclase (GGDEF)-like protein n=1 Tax=Thalassotalea piscium TaxID=1230533 RepID=A0A7X0NFW4_9GAMM|nr:bifunctional diguanylate cyclase/phosphodiesterase [Thalassotalea piscium]MBB6542674.1 diguanylate cyclase (GGDEF)-like protein [Thalassotalea piscium]
MKLLLNSILGALEQIVFELVDEKTDTVKLVAGDASWAKELFPQLELNTPFIINDNIPFLQDFLFDAKFIWSAEKNGSKRSGFWTEVTANQNELNLEAIAIKQDEHNLLLVINQSDEFKFRQSTLQSAREMLLSNDLLVEQNQYLHDRILSILKKPNEQSNILVALTKAIENAGFAVVITNKKFVTIIENSATKSLFGQHNLPINQVKKSIDIILSLMRNQLPEFDRIMSTKSSWDGELCWILPPSTLKWLKIAVYPVTNELNEIKNWIFFANDISISKSLVQKNEELALHDMLTKLPNRFGFWQTLEQKAANKKPFYLLYLDINDFRTHNEYFGHEDGDKLLIDLSKRIKTNLKKSDYIARVGGDEFGIILSNIDNQESCKKVIKRIIDNINAPFYTNNSKSFTVTISIGAAGFPTDADSVEELMRFVDLSAYSGKTRQKSSLQFYSQAIKDASQEVIRIEQDLRTALKNNEFELYLQPIIDLERDSILKAEALIRWNHPIKGLILPDDFIPVAEKSGLITTIGHWVINAVCELLIKLSYHGFNIKISMNLSPTQVLEEGLFSYLHRCIKKHQIDPSLLELEVTEGVLVNDYRIAERLLSKVRAIGMSVSVDDFGTGYSSLAYLKKLPLDFIKVDKSFIKDIVTDDNDKAIVRAVIAMAHNLHLGVVAEGVETEEQLSFLKQNACNSVQGYLFSHPVSFELFLNLLKSKQSFRG